MIAVILITAVAAGLAFNEANKEKEERSVLYSDGNITVTTAKKYTDLVYVDSLYSDNMFTVIANLYYKPDYEKSDDYTAQDCGGWMLSVVFCPKDMATTESGLPTIWTFRATDGNNIYMEERPTEKFYQCSPSNTKEYMAVLESIEVDYGSLSQYTNEEFNQNTR